MERRYTAQLSAAAGRATRSRPMVARDARATLAAAATGLAGLLARAFAPGLLGGAATIAAAALLVAALARLVQRSGLVAATHRALAESHERLRASDREHRRLFEHNPQPLWVYDRDTLRIVAVSNAATAAYGYSREEFLAMTILDLRPTEDVGSLLEQLGSTDGRERRGLVASRPWRHRYRDGTVVEVEVTSDDVIFEGRECRIVLSVDVTERNRAAMELARARDAALEAGRVRSAFLANMSHELRTPMNGVIGMNELLLATSLDDDQRYMAEHIASSGARMVTIIDDILDIAAIDGGRLELRAREFDLVAMISHVCLVAGAEATAKGLALVVQIDETVPKVVRGDDRRIGKVLANLVSNAVKFTASGSVQVAARALPGVVPDVAAVRVEITDTGVGIEPDDVQRVFEPFAQGDMSPTRAYGGTGLGLAIARDLVELMGGAIGVESEVGSGSTFWFELSLAIPAHCRGSHRQRPRRGGARLALVAAEPAGGPARRPDGGDSGSGTDPGSAPRHVGAA